MDNNTPWWVAGVMSLLSIGYAVLKLVDYFKGKRLGWRKDEHDLDKVQKQALTEEQIEARQVAAKEAVPVVERLLLEVAQQADEIKEKDKRIAELEKLERHCSQERASDKMLLFILATWAKTQKNPPPIPDDVLKEITGSRSHTPLEGSGS